jgi:protease IV
VFVVPSAILDITGLATEVTFYRGTLDKLGVQAQFEGVGKYKNAPNQFTEEGLTEPHREQMEDLLDSVFGQYLDAIAKSRGKTHDEARAALDGGPYDGTSALAAGLVDELLYEDELEDRLDDAEEVTPSRYVKASRGFHFDGRPKLAVVYVVGEILPGESQDSPFGGSFAGSDTVSEALRDAREDDDIKGVILRVDSPGGSGTASDVIWREVELTRKKKPVVTSMGDVAASGGYYVAMGTDAIVAQPSTITGSIGVFGGKFSLGGLYDKLGLHKEVLKRGRHSDLFDENRPWSDEERAHVHRMMAAFYTTFVTKAAEGRKKSYEEIDAVAQGRVWTGEGALEGGLVDRLGGFDVALAVAKEKAKIPASQEVQLVVLPERKGLFETFLERQEEGMESALPEDIRALLRWAVLIRDGQPLTRLPFELRIH